MMEHSLRLLKELTEAPGVPGHEVHVAKVIEENLEGFAEVSRDKLGSVVAKKQGSTSSPKVMLAAHMDEVGMMVTSVTKEGVLRFIPLGGWWDQVMLAQRVSVKTARGDLPGVIGSKPPHILPPDERKKVVEKKDMFIDIGAADEAEAKELGVRPGDPVVPVSPFTPMAGGKVIMAKALDDRVGCALMIEALQRLREREHPNTVYGVGTVQEEVGLRGAKTSVSIVEPDVGIALEVAIAGDTPGIKEHEAQSKLGGGPVILLYDASMIPNLRLRDLAVEVAESLDIPYQFDVMTGGATDAGHIHLYASGVPSIVLGVPTRYIHSHVGVLNMDDYRNTVKLLTELLARLDESTVRGLTD